MHFHLSVFCNVRKKYKGSNISSRKLCLWKAENVKKEEIFVGVFCFGLFFSQIDSVFCRQTFYCDRTWRYYNMQHRVTLPFTFNTPLSLLLPWRNCVATNTSCQCDAMVVPDFSELKYMVSQSWSHDSIKLTWLKYIGKIPI